MFLNPPHPLIDCSCTARGLARPTCPWICHFALRGASCNHTMGILQKFSESAFPLICLGAPQPSSSVPRCAVPRPETNYADEPRKVMQAPASRACTRRRARRMSRFPRAMRRTREERRGYPRALARSPRPFSSSAQLERVTYSRPSVGRLSVGRFPLQSGTDSAVDLPLRPANFSDRPKDEIVNESSAALSPARALLLPAASIRNMI